MQSELGHSNCFDRRAEHAGRLVACGNWVAGHSIASSLLRCAQARGCQHKDDCARAAHSLIGQIRHSVAG
jgi:hypothetical protein